MKLIIFLFGLALQPTQAPSDLFRECKIETATLCGPDGCRSVEQSGKLYMGDYANAKGDRARYYYRCNLKGGCVAVDQPLVRRSGSYRTFIAAEQGAVSSIGPDDQVTDVFTRANLVQISRGTCQPAAPPAIVTPIE